LFVLFIRAETLIITIFTADYLLRLLTVHAARKFKFNNFDVITYFLTFEVITETHKIGDRVKGAKTALETPGILKTITHVLKPMNMIDLISILPFYFAFLFENQDSSLTVIRILRLCRLFRLFKLKKYSAGFEVFLQTLVQSMEAITVLLFILTLLLVFLGSLIYLAEGGTWFSPTDLCDGELCGGKYPDGAYLRTTNGGNNLAYTPFTSIFESCWFIMATITTVGYGDMTPTTDAGRAISMLCMILGVLSLAMPITVLGNNFR
jgi:hypothetical protein